MQACKNTSRLGTQPPRLSCVSRDSADTSSSPIEFASPARVLICIFFLDCGLERYQNWHFYQTDFMKQRVANYPHRYQDPGKACPRVSRCSQYFRNASWSKPWASNSQQQSQQSQLPRQDLFDEACSFGLMLERKQGTGRHGIECGGRAQMHGMDGSANADLLHLRSPASVLWDALHCQTCPSCLNLGVLRPLPGGGVIVAGDEWSESGNAGRHLWSVRPGDTTDPPSLMQGEPQGSL